MDSRKVWDTILANIRGTLNAQTFERWFTPCRVGSIDKKKFILEVPNIFYKNWILEHYGKLIEKELEELFKNSIKLGIDINSTLEKTTAYKQSKDSQRTSSFRFPNLQNYFSDYNGGALNPKYTFNNFVEGASNRFARAGCMAVAQAPAKAYNPLFIYGGVGLGKTHLMQAIGHYMLEHHKKAKVFYTSSEHFTNHLIDSLQQRKMERFRRKYRTMNALFIDDIQFLCGKEQTQEEFFHTFNTLFDHNSQIVVSADRAPSELSEMEERLISRFQWGLVVDLQLPDLETRVAIVKKNAEYAKFEISDDVAFFLADRVHSNIRQLEGALIRVASYASLMKHPITIALCENVLEDILLSEENSVTLDDIQKLVAEHFDIRVADMKSNRRPKAIAYPRQIAMYLARELTTYSLHEIGQAFGGRDHSTIVHGHKTIKNRLQKDPKLKITVSSLNRKILKN